MELKRDTLILLFSRPDNGKQLATTARAHQQVWRTLQQHSRQQAAATGLPVRLWDAAQQVGSTFAERLTHALSTLQQEGWQRVIIIGDDCPELRHMQLTTAARALENGHSVLGPDKEGGAYLIGLALAAFNPATFLTLPWQTDHLLPALAERLSQTGPLHTLSAQQDVDTLYALQQLVHSHRLVLPLQRMLSSLITAAWAVLVETTTSSLLPIPIRAYRGPPAHT